ncbi:MAG: DUF3857 domain-containing protein [Rhodocyclaceae bacterium]|nr:DUF3857 domain-containing protein [Rhodocyclaceae bacterium]
MKKLLQLLTTVLALAAMGSHAAVKVQKAGLHYQIERTPVWVVNIADAAPVGVPPGSGPTQVILADTQVNLLGTKPQHYSHFRTTARERSGLENVSTDNVTFNPRFETLTLHQVSVIRDGKRIDRLKSARVDLAQREAQLEQGIYDENVMAIIAIDDVRVGDIVDCAYTIAGENPVFGGRYSQFFGLNRTEPLARLSIRISYPATRKLFHKMLKSPLRVDESEQGGTRVLSLIADDLPMVRPEEGVPAWFQMYPALEVTEYESWEQVQQWAAALYKVPTDLSPEIMQLVARLRDAGGSDAEKAARTLAWVQNDIRYYSIAVGTSSHRPNHPNQTFRQRFGDCKDKSVLLSALLQKLGIKAVPALVSLQSRRGVADWLPTPWAFDHVIARTVVDNTAYWLDGTQTHQGSVLATLGSTPFGKALVTDGSLPGLSDVVPPPNARDAAEVIETFSLPNYGASTEMKVEMKYTGGFAEGFRRHAAETGLKRYIEALQSDYGRDFPNVELMGDAGIADDPKANVVSLTQAFRIPPLFSYDQGRVKTVLYANSLLPIVRFRRTPSRQFPLGLPYPASYSHRIVIELPAKAMLPSPSPESWQDSHIALSSTIRAEPTRLTFDYRLRTLADHVAATDFAAYSEKIKQGANLLATTLALPLTETPELRARLVRELEKNRLNQRNPDQAEILRQNFVRDYAVADEAISGNLLSGALLAKAYEERAAALSYLGRRDEALMDAERSIELKASDSATLLKAEILLYAGRYREARSVLERAPQRDSTAQALADLGMVSYYLDDFAAAQRYFSRAAELATAQNLPHVLIWLAMAAQRDGGDPKAALQSFRPRLSEAWPAEGVALMVDEISADKLIESATAEDKEKRMRLCEAYFYLGQKALLAGDRSQARRWFAQSADTGVTMYLEHIFSQLELKRLDIQR